MSLWTRFDGLALAPFVAPRGASTQTEWTALRDWCLARPAVRFAVAVPAPVARPAAARCARDLALQLDGSHALAACASTAAGLMLRLRVKWQDLASGDPCGEALSPDRVWDSGRVLDAAALSRFQPRRPTFIVVDNGSTAALLSAIETLQAHSARFAQPVRALWLLPTPIDLATRHWAVLPP